MSTDRRGFLKTAGAVAAGAALAPQLATAASAQPGEPGGGGGRAVQPPQTGFLDDNPRWVVKPFPLHQVSLRAGTVFAEKRDRLLRYAEAYPADRVLHNFRVTAGLPTPPGSAPPGGWDDETGNLRGHFSGHLLTLFAQAYASTGEPAYRDTLDYLVSELAACQRALARSGDYSHPGFLAAYPETQFVRLEQLATYPTIWAPYYTCHKIMRGLLDAYLLAGIAQALAVATAMGDWVHSRLSRLDRALLDQMWAIYIAGEYGAMNEVMAELYALTGRERYLVTATYFDNRQSLFDACVEDRDILTRLHANTHVPQFLGYLRVFDQSGETDYYTAAENFWRMVVPHRMYSHGGTSGTWPDGPDLPANDNPELFQPRGNIAGSIAGNGAETCTTYNLLKVTRNLFFHDPDPAYLDYYERGLVNHILGSRRDADSTSSPAVTYFVPLRPGNSRGYGNLGTCCGGTGLENHTKYQESIYFRSADGSALYVNLYVGSELRWAERGITLTQTSDFPRAQESTLTFTGGAAFELRLRVPAWAQRFQVRVNGVPHEGPTTPGTFLRLARDWQSGDTVQVSMPFPLRVERAPDDPAIQSVFHGPLLLPAISPATDYRELSLYRHLGLDGDLAGAFRPAGPPSHFTSDGHTFRPLYLGDAEAHHPYLRRHEPTVVFGEQDSQVPNRTRDDGTSFLDALWSLAPFPDRPAFLDAAERTSADWVEQDRFSPAERQAILRAARAADLD